MSRRAVEQLSDGFLAVMFDAARPSGVMHSFEDGAAVFASRVPGDMTASGTDAEPQAPTETYLIKSQLLT